MAESGKSPKAPSAEEFKAMLWDGLANIVKKEQLDQMMMQIKCNTTSLVSLERKVDSTNDGNERRFQLIENRLDSGAKSNDPDYRRAAFDKCRRSLRAWPIGGDSKDEIKAAFCDFAIDALLIPDTVVRNTSFADVIRVRNSPQNAVFLEIIVTFLDPSERDFFFSKAKNLASYRDESGSPTTGIRMDIVPYLLPTFKLLNSHGFEIRNSHGNETRRYIKFDEDNLSLYLEIRLPGQQKWIRIKADQARSYSDEKDRIEYMNIRKDLMMPSSDCPSNPNFLPLGTRSGPTQSTGGSLPPSVPTIDGRRPQWIPPGKDARRQSGSHGGSV